MSEDTCPKCGAETASKAGEDWQCGTYVAKDSECYYLDESKKCLRNQITRLQRENEELRRAVAVAREALLEVRTMQCHRTGADGPRGFCPVFDICRQDPSHHLCEAWAYAVADEKIAEAKEEE